MSGNYGIKAMEIYFPKTYISQTELEKADNCIGKYTQGLGQSKMGVCTDLEDINSICLTVTMNLFKNFNVNPVNIGFLEVGTESIIDKSKSTKTVLMQLFESSGNTDVQGVDVKNACFGGTAALLSALDWLESSNCDGRLALVVAGDIAVYAENSARCTGGAGAIAVLLGPDAPLVFDRGVRSHHMSHQWDFYKPRLDSEYPYFDGKKSVVCYQTALNNCFDLFKRKCEKKEIINKESLTFSDSVYFCFHSPYTKLVQKSFARLVFNDLKSNSNLVDDFRDQLAEVQMFLHKNIDETYEDRNLDAALMKFSQNLLTTKIEPSLHMARNIGNMYTASLYSCLISLLINLPPHKLCGSRVVLFSYGSGSAACMFSLTVTTQERDLIDLLSHLQAANQRLETRVPMTLAQFETSLHDRDNLMLKCDVAPCGDIDSLFPGTYYLTRIDERYRRHYKVCDPFLDGDNRSA